MRFAYLIFLLFATAFFHPHASAQEADPIGSVDAVFGAVEDKAIVIGSFDGEIPSGVYPATIEDVNGFLAVIDVEVDGNLNTVFGYILSALIPNDGTPMQMTCTRMIRTVHLFHFWFSQLILPCTQVLFPCFAEGNRFFH